MATPITAQPKMAGANLTLDGKSVSLPIVTGSEAESAIDIQALRNQTGFITLDPGYGNTGACRSAITFIDGEQGILRYRGYPIEELAEKSTFLEVSWLLLFGELPTKSQLDGFIRDIRLHTLLHENFRRFFEALPKDAHPMPVCSAAVGALATFYQLPETEQNTADAVIRLMAKMPTIAAYSFKHSIGQPFMYPNNRLDYAANFLTMMFGTPAEEYVADPVLARAVDLLLILHADHEQNCSTSTVRMVGTRAPTSSPASPPASARCGARSTAAPTSRSSRCWTASRRRAATPKPSSSAPRARRTTAG